MRATFNICLKCFLEFTLNSFGFKNSELSYFATATKNTCRLSCIKKFETRFVVPFKIIGSVHTRVPQFWHWYCDKYTIFREGAHQSLSLALTPFTSFTHFTVRIWDACLQNLHWWVVWFSSSCLFKRLFTKDSQKWKASCESTKRWFQQGQYIYRC